MGKIENLRYVCNMSLMPRYIKKICFIILFLNIFSTFLHAEVVSKVVVEGNERISYETVMIYGDVTIGKDYKESDINSLIKKLYETNFFSKISVELNNKVLNIKVEENPIINAILLEGEKAKKFKEKIFELLVLKEKGSFISGNVKDDINLINSFYVVSLALTPNCFHAFKPFQHEKHW